MRASGVRRIMRTVGRWSRAAIRRLRYRRAVALLEKELNRTPDSPFVWKALAGKHEAEGNIEEAIDCWRTLALLYRKRGETTDIAFSHRKMISLGCPEPARLYRDLATICAEWRRYEEASRACRRVVEAYLAEGHQNAAVGYVRNLPPLGSFADSTRAELERLIEASSAKSIVLAAATLRETLPIPPPETPRARTLPSRPAAQTQPSPAVRPAPRLPSFPTPESTAESMRTPIPHKGTRFVVWEEEPSAADQTGAEPGRAATTNANQSVFLQGTLGRVTPFDAIQVAENNLITGRLCVDRDGEVGTIYFDKGKIVAAKFGAGSAHAALKLLLMTEAGPFTLEIAKAEEIPPDEFHAKNNTTLLVSVLRIVDAERELGGTTMDDRSSRREPHTTGDLVKDNATRDSGRLGEFEDDFDRWDLDDTRRRN